MSAVSRCLVTFSQPQMTSSAQDGSALLEHVLFLVTSIKVLFLISIVLLSSCWYSFLLAQIFPVTHEWLSQKTKNKKQQQPSSEPLWPPADLLSPQRTNNKTSHRPLSGAVSYETPLFAFPPFLLSPVSLSLTGGGRARSNTPTPQRASVCVCV